MTDKHPITPPPELVEQWRTAPEYANGKQMFEMVSISTSRLQQIATQAARWGADQELEACCEWIGSEGLAGYTSRELRAARRTKPPSKKQRGLTALEATNLKEDDPLLYQEILNAIEGLPND